ncbi:MAG: hypothetical protein OEZ07_01065 [Dehalococcoidia bacterium]|nr:hypothetical protein [Dehalococcoidia bacterium]MDH5781146.1 hypothetical protein [Dehalococcoidia bacterium]
MKYLCKHVYRVPDGLNPKYFTVLTFKVPAPQKANDEPVILVDLYNVKNSIFLTYTSVESLNRVFTLEATDENLEEELDLRLETAAKIKAIRMELEKEIMEWKRLCLLKKLRKKH